MNENDKARLDKILVEHLGIDAEKVTPDANLIDDLMADSLDIVELVMAFEEEFRVEIKDDETEALLTVEDCYRCVGDKIAERAAA